MKKHFKYIFILMAATFSINMVATASCAAAKEMQMQQYYSDDIQTPNLNVLNNSTASNDTILDDYNYPNHYPVQQELNYFLWYGIIPMLKWLGANFYYYDSSFGTSKTFISGVLGAINSLGSDTSSNKDDKKNIYPVKISKQPFQINQRFLKDKSSTPRNFGPNAEDPTTATDQHLLDVNSDTSWVISGKPTISDGQKWSMNIPGFTDSIKDGQTYTLNKNSTNTFMNVINYDEHLLVKDIFLVVCAQLQAKTTGSAASDQAKIYSYWGNLAFDLVYSHNTVDVINPFVSDPQWQKIQFTKFDDDFVNSIVKRVAVSDTNKTINLRWGETIDDLSSKIATFVITPDASKHYYLIDKNKITPEQTDLSLRSQINGMAAPKEVEFNRPDMPSAGKYKAYMPDMVSYDITPTSSFGANATIQNPFNYFFEQAFLGITLYGGVLPKWYEGNQLLTINTANYAVSDEIFTKYYSDNYILGNDPAKSSLYEQWDAKALTKVNNYYDLMNQKLNSYYDYSLNLLVNELWKSPTDTTIDIKEANVVIKPLKNNPRAKDLSKVLKTLSDNLKKYQDTKTDFNYAVLNHDWQVDIWNSYGLVVNTIVDYEKVPSTNYNLWILFGVLLGLVLMGFVGWIIYREYVLNNLRKRSTIILTPDTLESLN